MNYLGIDFGLSHIGFAISEGVLAEPWGQIKHTALPEVLEKIMYLCQEQKIETIVVGVSEGRMAEITQDFAEQLEKYTQIPVVLFDETLSSHTAKEYLHQGGASWKKRRNAEHQTAAAIILQTFLDEKGPSLL